MNISELDIIRFYGKYNELYGWMRWEKPNHFYVKVNKIYGGQISICDLGSLKGLDEITQISTSGYTVPAPANASVECKTSHGYVIKIENDFLEMPLYVRLFVVWPIVTTAKIVKGAEVTFQYPFKP
jgi:hypothetical protein